MKQVLSILFFLFLSVTTANASKGASLYGADESMYEVVSVAESASVKYQWSDKLDRCVAFTKNSVAHVADKVKAFLLMARTYSGTPFAYYNTSYVYINEAVKRFNIDNKVVNVILDPVSKTMSRFVVIADTFFDCLDNSCGFGAVFDDNYGRT